MTTDTSIDLNKLSLFGLTTAAQSTEIRTTSVKTLLAISHTIENTIRRFRLKQTFYAGFQRASSFLPQLHNFRQLAKVTEKIYVFVYPDVPLPEVENIEYVFLAEDSPLKDEWFLVFNHPEFQVSLLTQEIPADSQSQYFGRGRDYQGLVTFDPGIVIAAHRTLNDLLTPEKQLSTNFNAFPNGLSINRAYLYFNSSLISFLEKRNQQLSSLTWQLKDRNEEIFRLQQITRRMISDAAWENAQLEFEDDKENVIRDRKHLTVLFSDVIDFVRLEENTDPNILVDELNRYLNIIASSIYQNKGDVDKFMGDGVLAFFKDPLDAVRAAINVHHRLKAFNVQQAASHLPRFPTRISISTGDAIIAQLGSTDRKEVTVIGAPVNLASRINSYAPNDGLVLDLYTYQKLNYPNIGLQDEIKVKGFRTPKTIVQIEDYEVADLRKLIEDKS